MKETRLSMKIYPVKERTSGSQWSESQKKRMITVRIITENGKPDEETANLCHSTLLELGYGALDYNTHTKYVEIENLHDEQVMLHKLFNITLIA